MVARAYEHVKFHYSVASFSCFH